MRFITAIYTFAILLVLAITGFTSLYLSSGNDPYAGIISAMDKGDIKTLVDYFDEEVELILLDESNIYTSTEASEALEAFFTLYPPESFTEIHRTKSNNKKVTFIIGDLQTAKITFRSRVLIDRGEDSRNWV